MTGDCGGEAPGCSRASLTCVPAWANVGRVFRDRERRTFARVRTLIGCREGRTRQYSNPRPPDEKIPPPPARAALRPPRSTHAELSADDRPQADHAVRWCARTRCESGRRRRADPIRRPLRIRCRATHSLPRSPTTAAAATTLAWSMPRGSIRRFTAVHAADPAPTGDEDPFLREVRAGPWPRRDTPDHTDRNPLALPCLPPQTTRLHRSWSRTMTMLCSRALTTRSPSGRGDLPVEGAGEALRD